MVERELSESKLNGHAPQTENPLNRIVSGWTRHGEQDRRDEARAVIFTKGAEEASNPNQTAEGFEAWFNNEINSQETDPATKMRAIIGARAVVKDGRSPLTMSDIKGIEDRYTSTLPLVRLN